MVSSGVWNTCRIRTADSEHTDTLTLSRGFSSLQNFGEQMLAALWVGL